MTRSRWLNAAGTLLFVVCLVFLAQWLQRSWPSIRAVRLLDESALVGSAFLYAISHLSTAVAWPFALRSLGERIPTIEGIRIGLLAQIGKYLPGNVAHYVGRAAIAARQGVSVRQSALSTVIELSSAVFASFLVASLCFPFIGKAVGRLPSVPILSLITAIGVIAFGVASALYLKSRGVRLSLIAGPTTCLAISFVLASLSFYLLIRSTGLDVPLALAIFAYVIAWGLGFVTPGAPAGLGVRETILFLLLAPDVGQGPALALAIGHRLLTAAVDGLAAVVGYSWTMSQPSS